MAFSDPDVMRWWNTPLRVEVADTRRDLVNTLDGEDAHMWVVHEAGQPVGLVGLLGDVAVPGLSWLLCRQAWAWPHGRGGRRSSRARVRIAGSCPSRSLGGGRQRPIPLHARRIGLTEHGRLAQRYPHREQPHETIVLGRSREPEPTTVLNIEVTLRVLDVAAERDLLRSVLGARMLYGAGDPPTMAGVVLGPWSVAQVCG